MKRGAGGGKTSPAPVQKATFKVRVIPRAKETTIQAVEEGALVVRLSAPPVEGKANDALREYMAESLGVRRSQIHIAVGEKSRHKIVEVVGVGPEKVQAFLARFA